MKQYRVCKAWPGVELGQVYKQNDIPIIYYHFTELLSQMLKEGWIELVEERKTLEEKFELGKYDFGDANPAVIESKWAASKAKDHYLGLLDEADKAYGTVSLERLQEFIGYKLELPINHPEIVISFLRKYLESEGNI